MTSTQSSVRVAVLGAGSWGTALAMVASRHVRTLLWARDPIQARAMQTSRENQRYLPNVSLSSALEITSNLDFALQYLVQEASCPLIILGVPVAGLHDICHQIAPRLKALELLHTYIVWTCKGLDPTTAKLPHEIAGSILLNSSLHCTGVLSGPSFAREVAHDLPVALTIASKTPTLHRVMTKVLHRGNVRVYGSTDVVGVEVGGALKNIMAVACGIADGLELGANARAALITRGLAEITRFGLALGAQAQTFSGLTGLGDLVLTATGELSRNRQFGLAIGQGRLLKDLLTQATTVEGIRCARAVLARATTLNIELPITQAVCAILFEGVAPAKAVSSLLTRAARDENK